MCLVSYHRLLLYTTYPFQSYAFMFPKNYPLNIRFRFALFHPEKLESAQHRYADEVKRIVGVLDRVLQGKNWLVGDKCTYADLAFVMWNSQIDFIMQGHDWRMADYPNFKRWQEAMLARDSLKRVMGVLMDKEVKSAGGA